MINTSYNHKSMDSEIDDKEKEIFNLEFAEFIYSKRKNFILFALGFSKNEIHIKKEYFANTSYINLFSITFSSLLFFLSLYKYISVFEAFAASIFIFLFGLYLEFFEIKRKKSIKKFKTLLNIKVIELDKLNDQYEKVSNLLGNNNETRTV